VIRRLALSGGVAMMLIPGMAWAQYSNSAEIAPQPLSPGIVATPDAPLPAPTQVPSNPLPAPDLPDGSLAAAPGLSGGVASGDQATAHDGTSQSGATQSGTPAPAAQIPPVWDRRAVAVLDILDKEDGAVRRIRVPVGSSVIEGRLGIEVGACLVRPADMVPDAAMFVTVTSTGGPVAVSSQGNQADASPLFKGWLIRSEPGATVVGDAALTFRLIGCGAG